MFGFLKNKKGNTNLTSNLNCGITNNDSTENKKEVKLEYSSTPVKLNLTKEESSSILNLRKETFNNVCNNLNLSGLKSRVALVLDFSGSMAPEYNDGTVQGLIERIIPIAMQFDDNGELDFWIFSSGFHRLDSVNNENYYNIAKKIKSKYSMGGTRYTPVMEDIIDYYMNEEPSNLPSYILFITDGDNSDKTLTTEFIVDNCDKPIFWQFVGIGNDSMDYLERLDDLPNREVDNVDFFRVTNVNKVTDESLYSKLLDEYPSWLNIVKS